MSYSMGRRINDIRVKNKVSQEEIASALGISRQRFARIENGQSEITYKMLKSLADYFGITPDEITSSEEDSVDLKLYFRDKKNSYNVDESVEKIMEILRVFRAHEKLYYRMKEKNNES